ncbi:hypothetical protein PV326_000935, partial [Microctonus aethiopoides]
MHLRQPHANYLTGQILLKSNYLACASRRFWFSRTNSLAPIGMHKDTAREAVTDKTINNIQDLTNILREYFAPRKSYLYYCAEIQAVRLRRNESVLDYYTRIKMLKNNAHESRQRSPTPKTVSFKDEDRRSPSPYRSNRNDGQWQSENFKRIFNRDSRYSQDRQQQEHSRNNYPSRSRSPVNYNYPPSPGYYPPPMPYMHAPYPPPYGYYPPYQPYHPPYYQQPFNRNFNPRNNEQRPNSPYAENKEIPLNSQ